MNRTLAALATSALLASVVVTTPATATETPHLGLAPSVVYPVVGSELTITANTFDPAAAALTVRFSVTGANEGVTRACTTDADGQCTVSYTGNLFSPGNDLILAFVDLDGDGVADDGPADPEPSATLIVPWASPTLLTIFAPVPVVPVASEVTIEAHTHNPPVGGLPVRFHVNGSNYGKAVTCTTDAAGTCSVTYTGDRFAPGWDTVYAYIDRNNDGMDDGDVEPDAQTTVQWTTSSRLAVLPSAARLPLGGEVTLTGSTFDPPIAGLPIRFQVMGANDGLALACTTDALGQCSVSYTGGLFSPGNDTVWAYVDTNDNGANDAEPTQQAVISWIGPDRLVLAPSSTSLAAGSDLTITAHTFDPAVPDLPVRFSVFGIDGATQSCTTDDEGGCTVTYSGATFASGSYWITGYVDTNNNERFDEYEAGERTLVTWRPPAFVVAGFGAPVDALPAVNAARAGQTIPLRFTLVDEDGSPVTNLESVRVTATHAGCELGASPDQLEEYASGGSGLQHLGGGSYQFNWATPKSYAGSCKHVALSLPSSYGVDALVAEFAFRK